MNLHLNLRMNNDAFEGNRAAETARILNRLALQIEIAYDVNVGDSYRLTDANGNNVGLAVVEG